ncbi:phospholipase A2 inhibitor NAI-like [Leptodactylus fuscus]
MITGQRLQDKQERSQEATHPSTMKNLLALLCIVHALVTSVFSGKCKSCKSQTSTCEESEIECGKNQCMTLIRNLERDGVEIKSIEKGCGNERICQTKESITLGNLKYQRYAHCCIGDLCNNDIPHNLEEDRKPNGVNCFSCYVKGTLGGCKGNNVTACLGSETRCMDYRATERTANGAVENYSRAGCANPKVCIALQQNGQFDFKVYLELQEKFVNCFVP